MMEPDQIANLWMAIRGIMFNIIWIVPALWIISLFEAIFMNELLPIIIAWAIGQGSNDKDYVRGRVMLIWDEVSIFVNYVRKFAVFLAMVWLFVTFADAIWYVFGVS